MLIRCNCAGHRRGCDDAGHGRGDDYDAANDVKGAGPAYFGFVRDARARRWPRRRWLLQPKKGKPMSLKSTCSASTAAHISKEVLPDMCRFPA